MKSPRRAFLSLLTLASGGALLSGFRSPAPRQLDDVPRQQAVPLLIQSAWPATDVFQEMLMLWARKVEEMAGGRLQIVILPAGAAAPTFQLIDAVSAGVIDGGHGVAAYWYDKHKAASLFGSGPSFGMNAEMLLGWIQFGGGQALYEELTRRIMGMDVVSIFHGPLPTQPLGWYSMPIRSAEDLRGLRIRAAGMAAELFQEMGATGFNIPATEIAAALQRGEIDATEYNNPTSDLALGLPDARNIYMLQSFHQPMECFELLLNRRKFESLAPDLQTIIRNAALAMSAELSWVLMDRNSKDLVMLRDQRGIQTVQTPPAVLDAQLAAWDRIIERESRADPFFARVIASQKEWAQRVGAWSRDIEADHYRAYRYWFERSAVR